MLIKYYKYSETPAADLCIIEDVENVVVHGGLFELSSLGDDHAIISNHYLYDEKLYGTPRTPDVQMPMKKMITFRKDGILCRLSVVGTAYVCNNDGKTIEKVAALSG